MLLFHYRVNFFSQKQVPVKISPNFEAVSIRSIFCKMLGIKMEMNKKYEIKKKHLKKTINKNNQMDDSS